MLILIRAILEQSINNKRVSKIEAGMSTTDMCLQGRRQGKSLEGAKLPRGSRGQRPLAGVQGAEPLGGGQGAKPPEADTFLVLKS